MASYDIAKKKTARNEGLWADNPHDRGAETYAGISRKNFPAWKGWEIIDREKRLLGKQPAYGAVGYQSWVKKLNAALTRLPLLARYVDELFRETFWNRNRLGEIVDQDLANWLYDMAVNTWDDGNRAAQRAVGVMPDGCLGPISIKALNAADPKEVIRIATEEMKRHYIEQAKKPGQREFLPSWLARLGIPKAEREVILATV